MKQLLLLLRLKMTIRERNYVTRSCLSDPFSSAWQKILRHGSDINMVALTSLTRCSFRILLKAFIPEYRSLTRWRPGKLGRPPKLSPTDVLGLLLTFYSDTMGLKSLCVIFGVPPATTSRTLQVAEEALNKCLRGLHLARICWPTLDEQVEWASLVESKNSMIKGRWGFIDGKNYKVQKPTQGEFQNAMYNGWLHATFVTGCFCFGADGCVVWGKHNVVGSWNDGDISRGFQEKLSDPIRNVEGHGVLSDSAFPVQGDNFRRIMTPMKEGDSDKIIDPITRAYAERLNSAITSLRQPAEWGMGAVEKVYRRLLLPLPFNQIIRGRRLRNIYMLYNFRVRTVGISQIKNYFN